MLSVMAKAKMEDESLVTPTEWRSFSFISISPDDELIRT